MISRKILQKKHLSNWFQKTLGLAPYLVGMETPEMASWREVRKAWRGRYGS